LGCGVQANTNNNINIGTSSTVTSASINRTLKVGVTGEDVKVLQRFLKITADGKYGNWTATNLKNWQKANGLYPDGSFGPMSRQKAGLTQ
jgi:peptidoglycan hydrolase-like protein with peptidoglycan-binding domain